MFLVIRCFLLTAFECGMSANMTNRGIRFVTLVILSLVNINSIRNSEFAVAVGSVKRCSKTDAIRDVFHTAEAARLMREL